MYCISTWDYELTQNQATLPSDPGYTEPVSFKERNKSTSLSCGIGEVDWLLNLKQDSLELVWQTLIRCRLLVLAWGLRL